MSEDPRPSFSGHRTVESFTPEELGDLTQKPRHPPNLRGRSIGMFHQARRLAKIKAGIAFDTPSKLKAPIASVSLPEKKLNQIERNLLKSKIPKGTLNTTFKHKFTELTTGKIEEKLQGATLLPRNEFLDEELYEEFETRKQTPAYQRIQPQRTKLPSFHKKEQILNLIEENQVVVISGETGCGKTTQVSQFILDDFVEQRKGSMCRIICTQPRRISAISISERVAQERGEHLGVGCGYQIRLEKKLPRNYASVTFCTTGVVLRLMQDDPCLSKVSHIILDEIHERDVSSDFLIALLKQVITQRKDLKLILMSATLNAEKFSDYYQDCPHINIPGFTFPVKEYYLEDVLEKTGYIYPNYMFNKKKRSRKKSSSFISDFVEPYARHMESNKTYSRQVCEQLRHPNHEDLNLELILSLLIHICRNEKDQGAILAFLPGYADISTLNKLMRGSGKFPEELYLIIPLHSIMPTINQKQIFEPPPRGVRKVILATNIAETSITIDDVVFVIDCGRIKMTNFDPNTNTQTLNAEWVALANASQRRGRAGRVQAGVCFHLYTKIRERFLENYPKPEILRTRLENTILSIKALQLGKAHAFLRMVMEPPDSTAIDLAVSLLKRLNALDEDETLTPLGYHLAKLPISPQMGKMILLGTIFSCLDPILSIAAALDFKDPFLCPLGKEREASKKKMELGGWLHSDHLLLHTAMKRYEQSGGQWSSQSFCREFFISPQIMSQLCKMKKQFMEHLVDMDFVESTEFKDRRYNRNSNNESLVKAIVSGGLYPNVGRIMGKRGKAHIVETHEKVEFHPKSSLAGRPLMKSPLFVYFLKLKSLKNYVHDATLIFPFPVIFFGDNFKYNEGEDYSTISIGCNQLNFKCSSKTYEMIKKLRDQLNWFLEYKVSNPGVVNWGSEEETSVLKAVVELITSEDIGEIDYESN